jgi:hypothetical protein
VLGVRDMRLNQLAGLNLAGIVALGRAYELRIGEQRAGVLGQTQQHPKFGWGIVAEICECASESAPG